MVFYLLLFMGLSFVWFSSVKYATVVSMKKRKIALIEDKLWNLSKLFSVFKPYYVDNVDIIQFVYPEQQHQKLRIFCCCNFCSHLENNSITIILYSYM